MRKALGLAEWVMPPIPEVRVSEDEPPQKRQTTDSGAAGSHPDAPGAGGSVDVSASGAAPEPTVDRTEAIRLICLLYTSPSPRDGLLSRMPSSA